MNLAMEILNDLGDHLLRAAPTLFVQSSILILLLLAFDSLFRNRVRATLRYALLLLVLVKLVFPPSVALPTSPLYWLDSGVADRSATVSQNPVQVTVAAGDPIEHSAIPAAPRRPMALLTTGGLALMVWLGVVAGLLATLTVRFHRFRLQTTGDREPGPELSDLLEECRRHARYPRPVVLRVAATAAAPAVRGLLHPVVRIPEVLTRELDSEGMRHVLLHELVHLKRGDLWINWAQTLLQIMYWWHPLLWFANARIRHVREEAVDETTSALLGAGAGGYPDTLIRVARALMSRPSIPAEGLGILEPATRLGSRVSRLLNHPAASGSSLGWKDWAAWVTVGAFLLPMAQAAPRDGVPRESPGVAADDVGRGLRFHVPFLIASATAWENLGLGPPDQKGGDHSEYWVKSVEEIQGLVESARSLDGLQLVGTPRVTTVSGREAAVILMGSEVVKFGDLGTMDLGASCRILPVAEESGVRLTVSNRWQFNSSAPYPSHRAQVSYKYALQMLTATATGVFLREGQDLILCNPDPGQRDGTRWFACVLPLAVQTAAPVESPPAHVLRNVEHAGQILHFEARLAYVSKTAYEHLRTRFRDKLKGERPMSLREAGEFLREARSTEGFELKADTIIGVESGQTAMVTAKHDFGFGDAASEAGVELEIKPDLDGDRIRLGLHLRVAKAATNEAGGGDLNSGLGTHLDRRMDVTLPDRGSVVLDGGIPVDSSGGRILAIVTALKFDLTGSERRAIPKFQTTILIRANGAYEHQGATVDLDTLLDALKKLNERHLTLIVQIQADASAPFGRVARLVDECRELGVSTVFLNRR